METVMVNWLAIIVAAVVSMIVGSIWYGPMFGKTWMKIMGTDPNMSKAEAKAKMKGMGGLYFVQFVLSIITIYILAHYMVLVQTSVGMSGVSVGIENAFWIWLGFIMPTVAGAAMWSGKSKKLSWSMFLISAGYNLVLFLIFGIILGAWH